MTRHDRIQSTLSQPLFVRRDGTTLSLGQLRRIDRARRAVTVSLAPMLNAKSGGTEIYNYTTRAIQADQLEVK